MVLAHAETHLATLLDQCATREAGIITYTRGERSKPVHISYSQLRTLARQNAELLRCSEHVARGKIVVIHFQSHLENIIWFWASILAGCVPCLSTPLVNNRDGRISHFKHLHRLLLDPIVVTTEQLMKSDFTENDVLRIVLIEDIESPRTPQLERPTETKSYSSVNGNGHVDNYSYNLSNDTTTNGITNGHTNNGTDKRTPSTEDLAVLMLTSGSTGNAKAVCLTHTQIFAAMGGKLAAMPLPEQSALLNWIALDHVASLVEIHLCAMFAGLDQVHVPAVEVIADPFFFLRLLCKHSVSRTFAPNFFLHKLQTALDAASAQDIQDINLNRLLYVASGGEPNKVDTSARVTEHLVRLGAPSENIITPGFGMTETCAGAIFNRNSPTVDIKAASEFTALGKCAPGIEMRVSSVSQIDLETTHTDGVPSFEGSLEIRGPIVFEKYFNNEDATREAFTSDGWFKTGDLAIIDACGGLRLVGRSKEVINVNGVKYLPHEIEGAIEQAMIPGISPTFVVCFASRPSDSSTEEIFIVYQHEYDINDIEARAETLHAILRTVMLFAGARPRVLPLDPGRLDKTTLGKLSRTKIRTSWEQGQYQNQENFNTQMIRSYRAAHFTAPRDDTERTLMNIFLDNLDLDRTEMSIDTPILDIGVSSVDLIRLKSVSEKAFGIADIPIITIMTNTTIRSLASAVRQIRQNSQYKGEYNPVITLQPNGSKTPLWLIHPGIGEVLVFLGLVQYFPDRPIYALRARGFNPGEKPFNNLTDVLTTYYNSLKQQQPNGPYAIAGYSYGSMIAFELSKMLEENGNTVQFLGSFNLPPHIKERMRTLDWTAGVLHIAHFCGIISEQRTEELAGELRELPLPEQVARLLAESDPQRCEELALNQDSLLNWTNVAWSLQKIGWEYDPSGSVSQMDIFYCQPLKVVARTREEYRNTKLNHWVNFARDDIRYHEVDGEHYTMIGPDHVPKFQQTLKRALAARGL